MRNAQQAQDYSQTLEFRTELRSIVTKYFSEYSECVVYSKFVRPSFYNYEQEKPCYIMELSNTNNTESSFSINQREDKEIMLMRYLYSRFNVETDVRISKTKIWIIWEMKLDD